MKFFYFIIFFTVTTAVAFMYVTIVGLNQSNIETFVGLYAVATLCCVLMSIKLDAYLEKRSTLKTLLESNQLKNN